ncbi:MAG: VOC family protein [Chloroflexi bacterium]|nr:VOC family protein [Chloroflexota bacterium]
MQLRKMDHTALVVRDLEQSRRFYGEILGLPEIPRPSNFTFGGCWFQGPDFQIHLILESDTTAPAGFADAGEAAPKGLAHHIAFEVADLNATLAHLKAHNIEIIGGPMPRGDGVIQSYVYDPSGNFLEFFMWDPNSTLQVEERSAISKSS